MPFDFDNAVVADARNEVNNQTIRCHEIHGRNVTLNNTYTIATRSAGTFDKALIFSSRKIRISELVHNPSNALMNTTVNIILMF